MAPVVMRHQDKEFSLLPIKQTGEILVLRKDHLCCFIPSDMIFGQIVLRDPIFETTSQQYGKMTRFTIRNHLDVLSADPNVREEITCLKLLQDDMIMVGSSFGRIIIYQILNFEPRSHPQSELIYQEHRAVSQVLLRERHLTLAKNML